VHSPDPSPYQAFRYGIHRALKAVPDRRKKDPRRSVLPWSLLKNIWRAYCRHGDARRLTALIGAETVLSGLGERLSLLESYSGDYSRRLFSELGADRPEEREAEIGRLWSYKGPNDQRWLKALYSRPWAERGTQQEIDPTTRL
jgi:hypothetical protein